jgi:hypothetical protein
VSQEPDSGLNLRGHLGGARGDLGLEAADTQLLFLAVQQIDDRFLENCLRLPEFRDLRFLATNFLPESGDADEHASQIIRFRLDCLMELFLLLREWPIEFLLFFARSLLHHFDSRTRFVEFVVSFVGFHLNYVHLFNLRPFNRLN